jgi:hypothetical protein
VNDSTRRAFAPLRRLARLASLAALAASACAPRVPPPDLSVEPEPLLAQVRAAQAKVRSVRGEARLSVESDAASGAAAQLVAAELPASLRIETLDFFGNPIAVLATSGGRFALWNGREKVFYRGPATPENLALLVPLPLAAEELVAILCGTAPVPAGARAVSATPGRGFVTLELALEDGRRQVLRVGAGALVERSEVQGAGGYRLRFEQRGLEESAPRFPAKVTLASDTPRVSLELTWREAEANVSHDPAFFRIEPPRGARVVELGNEPPPSPFDVGATAPSAARP